MGLTSVEAVARGAADVIRARGRGSKSLRALLEHQVPMARGLQFPLEVKTERLLRESRLPRPERQVPVGPYRLDFGYRDQRVAIALGLLAA
jgi:hypothetical protein